MCYDELIKKHRRKGAYQLFAGQLLVHFRELLCRGELERFLQDKLYMLSDRSYVERLLIADVDLDDCDVSV